MVAATYEALQTPLAASESLCAMPVRAHSANVIEFPVRRRQAEQLEHEIVLELATADDVASAMPRVVERLRRRCGAARVEWWAIGDDDAFELVAAAGTALGERHDVPVEPVGAFVVHGDDLDPRSAEYLRSLAPLIRRRAADDRLYRTAIRLAQRNQALEDFAALVAHELKSPLQAALVAPDPSGFVEDALDLVDTLIEAARNDVADGTSATVRACLDAVLDDLGTEIEVVAHADVALPLPAETLHVIVRNLVANAVAAGARRVQVEAVRSASGWRLVVDDDGVGLGAVDSYASGSGLGLSLCRRIAGRFGAILELTPRPSGGTRATLECCAGLR
jgi:signal transduction histidine kinase